MLRASHSQLLSVSFCNQSLFNQQGPNALGSGMQLLVTFLHPNHIVLRAENFKK
jgi:hypothetical protein